MTQELHLPGGSQAGSRLRSPSTPYSKYFKTEKPIAAVCGWDLSRSGFTADYIHEAAVAMQNIDIEAIVDMQTSPARAWKANGSPHPKYQAFLRELLKRTKSIAPNPTPHFKSRFIVLRTRIGGAKRAELTGLRTYRLDIDPAQSVRFTKVVEEQYEAGYRYTWFMITAPDSHASATLTIDCACSATSMAVPLSSSSRFQVLDEEFLINHLVETKLRADHLGITSRSAINLRLPARSISSLSLRYPAQADVGSTCVDPSGDLAPCDSSIGNDWEVADFALVSRDFGAREANFVTNARMERIGDAILSATLLYPVIYSGIHLDPK